MDRPYEEVVEESAKWDKWLRDTANDDSETISGEDVAEWVKQQAARDRDKPD